MIGKNTLLTCFLLLMFGFRSELTAQETLFRCGTMDIAETLHLTLKEADLSSLKTTDSNDSIIYRIPVVVHIIHNGGNENIPDQRVYEMIEILNANYRRLPRSNGDKNGADMFIEFFLARKDPNGNCHSGINRVKSSLTVHNPNTNDLALKNLSRWDRRYYLNIWVVRSMSDIIGYAFFPEMVVNAPGSDGLVLVANAVGKNAGFSNTPAHEAGHYFGLFHTFQDGCVGGTERTCARDGDRVCDTPPTESANFTCNTRLDRCTSDDYDMPANVNNYMDYGTDPCMSMFTQGQMFRARDQINEYRSTFTNRNNWDRTGYYDALNVSPLFGTVCSTGGSVKLTAVGAQNYTWSPSTGLNQTTGAEVIASPTQTTVYTVTGTGAKCTGGITQRTITVFVSPPMKLSVSTNDANKSITATVSGGQGPYKFRIDPYNPYDPNLYSGNNSFIVPTPGTYTIYVRDANGCQAAASVRHLVGRNELQLKPFELSLHPNPASESLNLRVQKEGVYQFQVCDLTGKTLQTGDFTGSDNLLSVAGYTQGLYFLVLTDPSGRTETVKWVKE